MRMNRIEKWLVNGSIKRWLHWHYEAPALDRLGGRAEGATALDVGCGNGVGMQVILARFGVATVDGLDIDPSQLSHARRRLRGLPSDRMRLIEADATRIPAADDSYDVVFDFGLLHHIIDWRRTVAEIVRVLRPGGRFYFEEVPGSSLRSWPSRVLLEHPTDDRFQADDFTEELRRCGLVIGDVIKRVGGNIFFGVGRLPQARLIGPPRTYGAAVEQPDRGGGAA
jgi:SAM-dependent methyltransferase